MWARGPIPALLSTAALLAAVAGEGRAQARAVVGTVFDSINSAPLVDAAVFLWETPYRGVSDEEGRFRIEGVPPGEYSILLFHTQLGEMGISPGARPLVVHPGDSVTEVTLATPSMATVTTSQCLMEERAEGTGILAGWVTDASTDVRMGGSAVTFSWNVPDSNTPERLYVRADAGGWYHTCSAPAHVPLLASASIYGREGLRREVVVEEGGYTEVPLTLFSLRPTQVAGRLLDANTHAPVARAEVWLRGTEGRTLSDDRGMFVLEDVPPGTYMLMTDHLSYGAKMNALVVPSGQRLRVEMRMDTRPIEIAPVTVTVEAPEPISVRMDRGGIVVTAEQIEQVRQRSRDASDVLRSLHIPGVIVRRGSNGRICVGYITGQVKMNQTGCVEMLIYLNDVRAVDPNLALRLPPDAIERMVIYKPVEAGVLFGLGGGNGVWMIYTRGN